ncbi:MAG TPA: hypothetical protein VLF64_03325 [Candidatus Saccharimonadales bacterium]|nr:hypothetical protein [Candidatus Saccharimonadales bacterium]
MKSTTVSINGTVYDSRTGMPLRKERSDADAVNHSAHNVHTQLQKSTTLNRRYVHHDTSPVAKPHVIYVPQRQRVAAPSANVMHRAPATQRQTPATRPQNQITHFAEHTPHPVAAPIADIGPTYHATVRRAKTRVEATRQVPERIVKPSQIIKQEAISRAMAEATPKHEKAKQHHHHAKAHKKAHRSKIARFMSVASASVAVLLLGAYFTYLNMPALSTRVAAAQAGIGAGYPGYTPNGYSLNGPVAYQQGSVMMKFAANAGPQNYTLSQTHSAWDSSALLEDYVAPQAGSNYITTTTGGLTIYSYNTTSVWVNNGILYTINGNSTLSDEQIQRIAASL